MPSTRSLDDSFFSFALTTSVDNVPNSNYEIRYRVSPMLLTNSYLLFFKVKQCKALIYISSIIQEP